MTGPNRDPFGAAALCPRYSAPAVAALKRTRMATTSNRAAPGIYVAHAEGDTISVAIVGPVTYTVQISAPMARSLAAQLDAVADAVDGLKDAKAPREDRRK